MKIIVLGAGQVGYEIAKQLSFEEHDVSVVDTDSNILKQVSEKLDVRPILGNAVDMDILLEAGITDANILVAATSSDETNIVTCQTADFIYGVETKIARISNKAYFEHRLLFGKNKFSIDLMVSPEIEISNIIKRSISVYGALDFIPCLDDKIRIVGIQCNRSSSFINIPIKLFSNVSNGIPLAVLFIERNNLSFIPQKNEILQEGDNVYLAVKPNDVSSLLELFGTSNSESNNIVLIGGGNISQDITQSISDENPETNIKIIENDIKTAESLSETLENIEIIYGDPLDIDILNKSLISDSAAVISVTNDDKTNILSCLIAKKFGAKRVAGMVKNIGNVPLFHTLGINSILDPKRAVIAKILQYIRKGGSENIFTLSDRNTEIFTISVSNISKAIGILVDDINSVNKIKIAILIRGDKVFFLPKRMVINADDKLLFIAEKNSLPKVSNLFKDKPKYLI